MLFSVFFYFVNLFHFVKYFLFFAVLFRSANIVYPGISDFERGKKLYNVMDLPGVQEGKKKIDILI
jgi:HSP20 family molecular chaperone IbpA